MADTTLYPTADAYVTQHLSNDNFGARDYLKVTSRIGGNERSFLKFSLATLPEGAVITLAKLRLYCYITSDLVSGVTDVEARRVADDSWTELGITWNNQPDYGAVEDTKVPAIGWVEWNVTDFVQDEWAGDKIVSLCMKSKVESYDSSFRYSYYRSKEYDSRDPELYIEYTVPVPAYPLIGKPLIAPILVSRPKIR